MLRPVLVCVLLAIAATSASAQENPIAKRREIYKSFGQAAKEPGAMLKKEAPFELAKVHAALRTFQDGSRKLPNLFPENSKTGGETAALPAIWENKADFDARLTKLATEANAAEAKVTDLDSFKAQFTEVQKNCGGCHQTYRKRQS
jgi:cytochrome c556